MVRDEILARIRKATGPAQSDTPIAREYRQSATLDATARLAQFTEILEDYNAGVHRCEESELAPTIAQVLSARSVHRLAIPPGLAESWLPAGFEFTRDTGLSHDELDRMEGALTACTAAISMTGTIMLSHSETEGRRALTLIPDYHLCIVRADQVVETVPQGIRKLRECGGRPITTISGPSATADIEMMRVKGVHGPRTLDVIVVS